MVFQAVVETMLKKAAEGYVFIPLGQLGQTYFVRADSARAVVWGSHLFGYTVVPMIASIVLGYLYYKATHTALPVLMALGFGVVWVAVFYVWAKFVSRKLDIVEGFTGEGEA